MMNLDRWFLLGIKGISKERKLHSLGRCLGIEAHPAIALVIDRDSRAMEDILNIAHRHHHPCAGLLASDQVKAHWRWIGNFIQ